MHIPHSVNRNRLKRLLREAFRDLGKCQKEIPPGDYFILYRGGKKPNFNDLRKVISDLINDI